MVARRVLMLSIGYGELGGVGTVTKELTEALHERGDYEVDVLSYWPWHHETGRAPFSFRTDDGTSTPFDNLDEFVKQDTGRYDLIQFHNQIFSDPYLGMIPENRITLDDFLSRYNAPTVMLTHSVALRQCAFERATWSNLQIEAQKQVMARVDRIIHLTDEQRDYVDREFPQFAQKSCVIGNGTRVSDTASDADIRAFRERYDSSRRTGLYLGRISNEKGIWELLQATARVRRERSDFKLLIAGNKDDATSMRVREYCTKQGLVEGTDYELLGWIGDEIKSRAIHAAEFVVLPSHYEHFPMTALEAMSRGTPCVMSDVVGPRSIFSLRDMAQTCALPIRKAGDVQSISESICHALNHPAEMRDIARRARSRVLEKYTWDKIAEEYHQLFDELLPTHTADTPEELVHEELTLTSVSVKPRVGIVVPTYNRRETVTRTIDSLLNQDYDGGSKMVVVDDGSIDETFEHLQKVYAHEIDYIEDHVLGTRRAVRGNDGKIILIRQQNKHVAAARNTGLRILHSAGCEFFSIQDAGDVALPHKIRTLVDYLDEHPTQSIIHARANDTDVHGTAVAGYAPFFNERWVRANNIHEYSNEIRSGGYVHNQTVMWRRSVIDSLGVHNLYWESLKRASDHDFFVKVARQGFDFGFADTSVATVIHDADPLAITPNKDSLVGVHEIIKTKSYKTTRDADALRVLCLCEKLEARPLSGVSEADMFDMRFETLFSLAFSRDFELKMGNLAKALLLAQEVVKHNPSEENRRVVDEIERRIREKISI